MDYCNWKLVASVAQGVGLSSDENIVVSDWTGGFFGNAREKQSRQKIISVKNKFNLWTLDAVAKT